VSVLMEGSGRLRCRAQVLMFVSHLRAMLTDPGVVPLEAQPLKGEARKVRCAAP
jgi:hypothetical protein